MMNPDKIAEIDKKYKLRQFPDAQASNVKVDKIDLQVIDLSLFKEGIQNFDERKALASKLENALSSFGFFVITNHGIEDSLLSKLKAIAQSTLELPDEIKREHLSGALRSDEEDREVSLGAEKGAGFKPRGYWSMQNGVRDSIEHYNFRDILQNDFFDSSKKYPEIVRAHLPEIAEYFRLLHLVVLRKISILCDIILEIPEGYLWENYFKVNETDIQESGHGFGRFMLYHQMKPDDQRKANGNWLRGHSDSSAFTFITSQPILSLQTRDYYTGEWKYVGHKPGGLIVNIGDAMEFITGGYFKSSIHRVVSPPPDQSQYRRLVIIYFSKPKNTSILDPEPLDSPKLIRLGYKKPKEWERISFGQWDNEKGRLFGKTKVNNSQGDEPNLVLLFGRFHERWHQADKAFSKEEAAKSFNIITV